MLDRAQFVAEVLARDGGEFQILRVVRGAPDATDRRFQVTKAIRVEARDCCDRAPHPVVPGNKYWAISPDQPSPVSRGVQFRELGLMTYEDRRAVYLSGIRDLSPSELREVVVKWRDGSFTPHTFAETISAVDVPHVSDCLRGYYHRLLMELTYMAWGNEDHHGCAPDEAARVRKASANSALSVLGYLASEGRSGKMRCASGVREATSMPSPLEGQVKSTRFLYPCAEIRAKKNGG